HNRTDCIYVSADACKLSTHEQTSPPMRLIGAINRVEGKARRELTGDDSPQRVRSTDSVEVDGFEVLLRRRAEGLHAGTLIRVRKPNALQRALDRIAGRKRESSLRLAEVLQRVQVVGRQVYVRA